MIKQAISNALDNAIEKNKIIILTGGLGPTSDDITKPFLREYFGGKMVGHQPTLDHITYIFEQIHKRPMIDRNRKQAEVPDSCEVLFNETGTAPGMLFKKNGAFIFSLPGVPHEMKWLTENKVIPYLQKQILSSHVGHRTLLTAGIGESFLAEMILDFESLTKSNSYFFEKRKEQNQFWMMETIDEQLKSSFYNHPEIIKLLEENKVNSLPGTY